MITAVFMTSTSGATITQIHILFAQTPIPRISKAIATYSGFRLYAKGPVRISALARRSGRTLVLARANSRKLNAMIESPRPRKRTMAIRPNLAANGISTGQNV